MKATEVSAGRFRARLSQFMWRVPGSQVAAGQAQAVPQLAWVTSGKARLVMVTSTDLNKRNLRSESPVTSIHKQPADTLRVLGKVEEIPRRSSNRDNGYDGLGVIVLHAENTGSPIRLITGSPAPLAGSSFHYDSMVNRMANEYDTSFAHI